MRTSLPLYERDYLDNPLTKIKLLNRWHLVVATDELAHVDLADVEHGCC